MSQSPPDDNGQEATIDDLLNDQRQGTSAILAELRQQTKHADAIRVWVKFMGIVLIVVLVVAFLGQILANIASD